MALSTTYARMSPCYIPFVEMQIEWNGNVMPCCNLRSDYAKHKKFVLARLTPASDLFATWCDKNYVAWRQSLCGQGPKAFPCAHCEYFA